MVAGRLVDLEGKIRNSLSSMIGMPVDALAFSAATSGGIESKGSSPSETTASQLIDDRAVMIRIDRNDSGCEWAYEHEVAVSNNVERLDNTFNNGFVVIINKDSKETENKKKEAKTLIEQKIKDWKLQEKTSVLIKNRAIYNFGILQKIMNKGDIVRLLELDCHEERCKPIIDKQTGELGGKIGLGLNPDNLNSEVAVVLKGKIPKYDSNGIPQETNKNFYLERDEIVYWTGNDRGKFKGTSPVKRVLRLVEIKKTLENVVDLMVRRFGPQIWIIVGNKDVNLSNTRLPESYMRGSDGNPIDEETARTNYKTALFENIRKNVQKWTDGEALVQIAEYGLDSKTFTPNTNLFQYSRYIDMFSDYIKVGIFGLDISGRVDVTSALMQDRLYRDLKDKAKKERAILINTYNKELIIPTLKNKSYSEDCVYLEFAQLDKTDDSEDALMEFRRSQTVMNYLNAGTKVPQYLIDKWGLDESINGVTPKISKSSPFNPTGTKPESMPKPGETQNPVDRTQTPVTK